MDVKCINAFMSSVKNVFQTMLKIEVEFGKPHVETKEETMHDVSGIIGLSGDVVGAVIVSFPKLSAVRIAGKFAGVALSEADEDFADAIGELANMIAGNAKKDIEGMKIMISTPSVVIGAGHQVKSTRGIPKLLIPCSCPLGSFTVEVGFKRAGKSEEALCETTTETRI
jgi:chemotaxis protein CheX